MKFNLVILLILGVWLGMVLGISFLEAPLKFRAPNMTVPLGLGIGQLVFSALNKIEIGFSVILVLWLAIRYTNLDFLGISLILLVFLVSLQSIWLLPVLSARVDDILQGVEVAKSNHHLYYVAMEVLKVPLLIYGFVKIYYYE